MYYVIRNYLQIITKKPCLFVHLGFYLDLLHPPADPVITRDTLEPFLGDYKIPEQVVHALLQGLKTKCWAHLPGLLSMVTTIHSTTAGGTDRSRSVVFICPSGVDFIASPKDPWKNSPSSSGSTEGSWSEISLVMITRAITKCLFNWREPFVIHTQSDILLPCSVTT